MICYLFEAPKYLFFSADVPELLYYSHLPAMVLTLLVGLFVYINNPRGLTNKLLLVICLSFLVWTIGSLLAWTNIQSSLLMFIWPFFGVTAAFISIFSIYFVYVFLYEKDAPKKMKVSFLLLLLPVLLLAHTNLSISGFDLALCDGFSYEGIIFKIYYTSLSYVAVVWIFVLLYLRSRSASLEFKRQIGLMGLGIQLFLLSFISTTSIVAYLASIGYVNDTSIELYSLFSMAFFMVMIGVLIVRFKTFNVSILAPQALVVALFILVASQFTYVKSTTSIILTGITLLLTTIAGLIIIRNAKKEIKHREEIEQLAQKLKKANVRLKELDQMKSEFVSIASHQLRSPLTSIRGYASMLLEGSYGKLPVKAAEAIERISDSSTYMASSIEDYLNVSRIEAGNMKYELSDFNLKDEAEHVADDKRQEAIKKGLLITFKSDMDKHGIINADIGKTRQILHNLVNNSIKYTPRGTITIYAHDDPKKKMMYVDIIDSGIGMKADELEDIFGKFERAHNANQTNVTGTGLGLFVARKMAREMKGEVIAFSDGVGHGSTFRFEMPLHM